MNLLSRLKPDYSKDQQYSIAVFAFLIGWIISYPYEGPVFYSLISRSGENLTFINSYSLFALAAGMLVPVFYRVPEVKVRSLLIALYSGCLLISLPLPFLPEISWVIMTPVVGFLAGCALSLNGYLIKSYFPPSMWLSVAPNAMLLGCAVIIIVNILIAVNAFLPGFMFIEAVLAAAIYCLVRLGSLESASPIAEVDNYREIFRRFWLLFLFVFLITINAGIMFQTVYPAFSHHGLFVSIYTNLPYIGAIIVFSKLYKGNKFNALYVGLALWGTSLLIFTRVDDSLFSFLIICTCMLFASGIFDLFWWTVSTTSFSYVKNPATMIGSILSVNVLGSWFGGVVSNKMVQAGLSVDSISIIGMIAVFVCMVLIVPLNRRLSPHIRDNEFLESPGQDVIEDTDAVDPMVGQKLSSRELDVFDLLCLGLSDKDISEQLNITISTVKTHNRKIYQKLEVKNRTELRRSFTVQN